jgi:genome maintenance exonuclease 1
MLTITTPYPYQEIKRKNVNGKRLYETESGALPSVTTILDKTKSEEKKQILNDWKKRVGEEQAQQIVTEAANVGTLMHGILEHWVKNETHDPGNNFIHQQAKRMAQTVIDNIEPHLNEVWGSEVNLYYPGLYAGTTDLLGVWKGNPAILDFKQTNKPKKREWIEDYFLQLTAYGLAHNEMFNTNITSGAIFMCSRECEFQLFEITEHEWEKYSLIWTKRVEKFYNMQD